jgi:hypothetical protein
VNKNENDRKSTHQSQLTAKRSELPVQDSYRDTLVKLEDNEKLFKEQVIFN